MAAKPEADATAEPAPGRRFFVYVVECADGSLYTGIATDVARRLAEHNGERPRGARYTAARRPIRLVYQASFPSRSEALKEELRIKSLSRRQKDDMITAATPS
jgi:putative endonuclease